MLLEVDNLKTYFRVGLTQVAQAVDGISLQLDQGKTLALVGESGCGKSQTAFSIIRLIAENGYHPSGRILFNGENLSEKSEEDMRCIRGNDIAMVFQEPMTSLNPLYRIGNQLEEPLRMHRKLQKGPARKRAIELLDHVGLPDPDKRIDDFPHQLSGGMKQRVLIAMALACEPKLLIADEPTTALDVTIQAQVLELIADMRTRLGMSVVIITHDLGVVAEYCDRVAVMYAGQVVETGETAALIRDPRHPYTQGLLRSIPRLSRLDEPIRPIEGTVPEPIDLPAECRFRPRCFLADAECRVDIPMRALAGGRMVRCIRAQG